MRSERSKRKGDKRHTVLEWGLTHVMIFGAMISGMQIVLIRDPGLCHMGPCTC